MVTSANAHERPVRSDAQPQRRRRRSSGGREPAPARKADTAGNRTTTPDRASPDRQPLPRPAREHAPADGRKGAAPLDWNDQPPASPEPGSGRRSSRRRSWTAQKRRPGAAAGALLVGILAFGAVVAVRSLDPQSPSGGGQLSATASDPLLASVQPLALTIAGGIDAAGLRLVAADARRAGTQHRHHAAVQHSRAAVHHGRAVDHHSRRAAAATSKTHSTNTVTGTPSHSTTVAEEPPSVATTDAQHVASGLVSQPVRTPARKTVAPASVSRVAAGHSDTSTSQSHAGSGSTRAKSSKTTAQSSSSASECVGLNEIGCQAGRSTPP